MIWKIIGPIKFMVANSIPKEKVTGAWFLDNVLHVTYVDPWLMLGVLMAYVVLFRLIQYSLLAYQTGTLPFTALYLCGTTQSKRHLRCAAIATDQPSADALQAATLTLELAMSKQLEVSKDIPPNDGGTLDFDISVQNVGAANESSSNDKAARPYRSLRDKPLSGHAHGFGSAEPESESVPDGYPPSKSEKLSAVEVSAHVSWKD